jgi:hypothetical protein
MKRGGIVPEGYWTLVQGFAFYSEKKGGVVRCGSAEVTKNLPKGDRAAEPGGVGGGIDAGQGKPRPYGYGGVRFRWVITSLLRFLLYAVGLSGTGWVARKSFWKRVA